MRVLYGLQPVLFATAPVLSFLASNMDSFAVGAATRALVLVTGGTLLLWGLLCAMLRDSRKAALMSCLVVVLFWSWTPLIALLPEPSWIAPVTMGLLWGAGLPLVAVLLARASLDLTPVYRIVTIAGLIGVVFPLASLARFEAPRSPATIALMGHEEAESQPRLPDIYLIILDAYGRDDELREHFGLEKGLGSRLRELGFYVADGSRTNYSTTIHSIPSLLNSDYIQTLLPRATTASLIMAVHENRIVTYLTRRGYETIAYASGFTLTELRGADQYIESPPTQMALGMRVRLTAFEHGLLPITPFDTWVRSIDDLSPLALHRKRILHGLSDISRHTENPNPTFVFLHILSPHEPFVFGEDGQDVSPVDLPYKLSRIYEDPDQPREPGRVGPEFARRYRAQAAYLSERVSEAAQEILQRSPEPPIILILGDHGPYGFSPNIRHPRFAILNAFFLPDGGDELLYPTISPVNSLRIVMNRYFGAELPILPERRFRSSYQEPNVYEEVF
jgi:hypothetical protein